MRDRVDHQGLVLGAVYVKKDILETRFALVPSWQSVYSVLMSTCASTTEYGWHAWDPDLQALFVADIPGSLLESSLGTVSYTHLTLPTILLV
eukprot:4382280-Amphidinium_carterae.1